MLTIQTVRGAIFDVDETLLDNGADNPVNALHEQARLQAIHEAGRRHSLPQLLAVTPQQNWDGFLNSPIHSLEGAVWQILYTAGVVADPVLVPDDALLLEIARRKDVLYEHLLRTEGKPVPGAVEFVTWLADQGLKDGMAVASTARRVDIDVFFTTCGLKRFFPDACIIAKDAVIHLKPHPEAFDKAFLTLGLPDDARGQVLAFEDNPRGIMSAKGAGLFTCAITTIYPRAKLAALEVPPDLIADSFDEFRQLLEQPVAA
jgi:HAD superfamily hydrolase (TIGR01509 family)